MGGKVCITRTTKAAVVYPWYVIDNVEGLNTSEPECCIVLIENTHCSRRVFISRGASTAKHYLLQNVSDVFSPHRARPTGGAKSQYRIPRRLTGSRITISPYTFSKWRLFVIFNIEYSETIND